MTKPLIKMKNKHIKCHIVKWANVNKLFWNKYVWKMHYELKNVQNVLGILLKTILNFRNNSWYKNFYSKNCRILNVFDTLFGYFWKKNKYWKYMWKYIMWQFIRKSGNLPLWRGKGNDPTNFYGNFLHKIMKFYRNNYPQKGEMVNYPYALVTENGPFPSMT